MPFAKGQSGNLKGRPPKNRALTNILAAAGGKTTAFEGKNIARERVVAERVWRAISDRQYTAPDGAVLPLKFDEWFGLVKWAYSHIDGPRPADVAEDEEQSPASADGKIARLSDEDLAIVEAIFEKYPDS